MKLIVVEDSRCGMSDSDFALFERICSRERKKSPHPAGDVAEGDRG